MVPSAGALATTITGQLCQHTLKVINENNDIKNEIITTATTKKGRHNLTNENYRPSFMITTYIVRRPSLIKCTVQSLSAKNINC